MSEQYQGFFPRIEYFVERKAWPEWKLEEKKIDFFDLTYIIDGKATYFVDKEPYQLQTGDVIFIRNGKFRRAYTDSKNPMHCFAFSFNNINIKEAKINFSFPVKFKAGIDAELMKLYKKFNRLWLENNPGYQLECKGLFLIILSKLMKKHRKSDNISDVRIEKIKQYIVNNYQEKIKTKKLAKMVNLNHIYLGNLFKDITGLTVNQYINMIRINMAEDLLLAGECNVSEAAFHCGFNDPFYFSKVFKNIKGVSPSQVISRKQD